MIDTERFKAILTEIEGGQKRLDKAIKNYAFIKSLGSQTGYSIDVRMMEGKSLNVQVSGMDVRTYSPTLLRGRDMIHLGVLKLMQSEIDDAKAYLASKTSELKKFTSSI